MSVETEKIFIRSLLPSVMLSFAEHYRPQYFLLENVRRYLNFPLLAEQDGHALKGGIQYGMLKKTCRVLIALG
jgi:hypothetical protein